MILDQDMQEKTDEELVALILENQNNFAYIIEKYKFKLSTYIKRISGLNDDDVEDVLQDVFIKTYQNLHNFDQDLKFSSWIYRIAHNQTISNFRKLKSRGENVSIKIDEELINKLASDLDIENEANIKILNQKINIVLISLDEKYREILVLKFFEEKDYQEISDIIKKPMGTVASLLSRAKKEFKVQLEKNKLDLK
jgi:RNA polymerase sigma-70 factor (ECF subfamily)